MTGCGQRGKPKAGFPRRPRPLGNRCAIPTFPQPRQRVGLSKTEKRKENQSPPDTLGFRLISGLENATTGRNYSGSAYPLVEAGGIAEVGFGSL